MVLRELTYVVKLNTDNAVKQIDNIDKKFITATQNLKTFETAINSLNKKNISIDNIKLKINPINVEELQKQIQSSLNNISLKVKPLVDLNKSIQKEDLNQKQTKDIVPKINNTKLDNSGISSFSNKIIGASENVKTLENAIVSLNKNGKININNVKIKVDATTKEDLQNQIQNSFNKLNIKIKPSLDYTNISKDSITKMTDSKYKQLDTKLSVLTKKSTILFNIVSSTDKKAGSMVTKFEKMSKSLGRGAESMKDIRTNASDLPRNIVGRGEFVKGSGRGGGSSKGGYRGMLSQDKPIISGFLRGIGMSTVLHYGGVLSAGTQMATEMAVGGLREAVRATIQKISESADLRKDIFEARATSKTMLRNRAEIEGVDPDAVTRKAQENAKRFAASTIFTERQTLIAQGAMAEGGLRSTKSMDTKYIKTMLDATVAHYNKINITESNVQVLTQQLSRAASTGKLEKLGVKFRMAGQDWVDKFEKASMEDRWEMMMKHLESTVGGISDNIRAENRLLAENIYQSNRSQQLMSERLGDIGIRFKTNLESIGNNLTPVFESLGRGLVRFTNMINDMTSKDSARARREAEKLGLKQEVIDKISKARTEKEAMRIFYEASNPTKTINFLEKGEIPAFTKFLATGNIEEREQKVYDLKQTKLGMIEKKERLEWLNSKGIGNDAATIAKINESITMIDTILENNKLIESSAESIAKTGDESVVLAKSIKKMLSDIEYELLGTTRQAQKAIGAGIQRNERQNIPQNKKIR